MIQQSREELKILIAKNSIDELFDILLDSELRHEKDIFNGLILLKGQHTKIKDEKKLGILSREDLLININNINVNLIEMIDAIPSSLFISEISKGKKRISSKTEIKNEAKIEHFGDTQEFKEVLSGYEETYSKLLDNLKSFSLNQGQVEASFSIEVTLEDILNGPSLKYQYDIKDFRNNSKSKSIVTFVLPKGINDGQKLKLRKKGHILKDGSRGDLSIVVKVSNHKYYVRKGNDLEATFPISYMSALKGNTFTIDILGEEVRFKVKPNIKNNTKLRLKGKGLPILKTSERGDCYIKIIVTKNGS